MHATVPIPAIRHVIVIDLTVAEDSQRDVEHTIDRQMHGGSIRGAHVRIILGYPGDRWPSATHYLASRILGCSSIDVENHGVRDVLARTFRESLARELQWAANDAAAFDESLNTSTAG